MKIINPIYDSAFKYLMENEQIAKIVLSIILDTTVVSLQSKPQESTHILGDINISRFDFKAVIQNESGENRSVLVEVQKYKTPDPIIRFRRYLAKNYLKEETIIDAKGEEKTLPLPIISICRNTLVTPFELITNLLILSLKKSLNKKIRL